MTNGVPYIFLYYSLLIAFCSWVLQVQVEVSCTTSTWVQRNYNTNGMSFRILVQLAVAGWFTTIMRISGSKIVFFFFLFSSCQSFTLTLFHVSLPVHMRDIQWYLLVEVAVVRVVRDRRALPPSPPSLPNCHTRTGRGILLFRKMYLSMI